MLLYNSEIKPVLKLINLTILLTVLMSLLGCQKLTDSLAWLGIFPRQITPIAEIPKRKEGSQIYLQGQVTRRAPFLGSGAYQLEDNTGEVWIVTKDSLPPTGEEILIQGQIEYKTLPLAKQDWGEFYILELNKLEPETNTSQERSSKTAIFSKIR
jgi:hypothetical protein